MSFLGQTNSSLGIGNVLNDLSALLSDISSDSTDTTAANPTAASANGGQNSLLSAPQNSPQLPGDAFGASQPNPMHAVGLILEGLGELMQLLGDGQQGGSGGTGGTGGFPRNSDPLFNSFNASDTGDPHLSFTGMQQGGQPQPAGTLPQTNKGGMQLQTAGAQTANAQPQAVTDSKNWDDMNGEQDMLHADINGGRYQLSTDVTTPVANGATLNKSAQISFGDNSVKVDNQGNVQLQEGQIKFSLPPGQSYTFANTGLQVSNSQDGKSLTVAMDGANGQNVSTTISQAGNFQGQNYLNISSSGNNVNLGGYMVDQAAGTHTENDAAPTNTGVAGGGIDPMMAFMQQEMALQQQSQSNLSSILNQAQSFQQTTAQAFGNNDLDFTDPSQAD